MYIGSAQQYIFHFFSSFTDRTGNSIGAVCVCLECAAKNVDARDLPKFADMVY